MPEVAYQQANSLFLPVTKLVTLVQAGAAAESSTYLCCPPTGSVPVKTASLVTHLHALSDVFQVSMMLFL